MLVASPWRIEPTRILTRGELAAVLADLRNRAARSASMQLNLVVFRLACCCGLRAAEIGGLRMDDVVLETARPHVRVRPDSAKGGRGRIVPLWWDAGTLDDLTTWESRQRRQRASLLAPFVGCQKPSRLGRSLSRHALRRRFLTACKTLGTARLRRLTIHHGRHTFVSHALAGGRTLAEVRDAAGHSSVWTTSLYLHVAVDDTAPIGTLFG